MEVYYNDNSLAACNWLDFLIRADLLPTGMIDQYSIEDVTPEDLKGYRRHHFFAGIGGWELALQLAGWPEEIPIWTGSCPCQPFSVAGKKKGTKDERHLWPVWCELIKEHTPPVIFGEQVASPLGREWFYGVRTDLEALGYEVGAADLCAACVGSPNIRQRIFWGACRLANNTSDTKRQGAQGSCQSLTKGAKQVPNRSSRCCQDNGMGNTNLEGSGRYSSSSSIGTQEEGCCRGQADGGECNSIESPSTAGRLDDSKRCGLQKHEEQHCGQEKPELKAPFGEHALRPWDTGFEFISCADGKVRRVESGTSPLVDGFPARVDLLRGLGNAIVPQVAAEFIKAFMEATFEKGKGEKQ